MCKLKIIFPILVLLFFSQTLFSQSENFGTWTTIGIEKKINKWNLNAETELRTIYYVRLIERWSLGVSASYNINKPLKAGLGYDLMNKLDTKYLNYQIRNRMNGFVSAKLKLNDISFTLRERIELTTKDDSKRIRSNGSIDTYEMNPEWSWRNRLQMSYNIPNFRITPSISAESFFQLNNPAGNTFDNFRYILSFEYKYKKRNQFELYFVYNSDLDSDDSYGKEILGLSYKYSL